MKLPIAGVIFDLDGVIADTAKYHFMAWRKIADELGIYFDKQLNERLKGIDRLRSLEILLENAGRVFSEEEKLRIAERKNNYYQQFIGRMSPDDLLPGALRALDMVKHKGLKVGLASASKNASQVLTKLAIEQCFDYVADAAKISKGKPDPEIFLTVADGLNLKPQYCIGIEDAVAGIKAIKAAGMYAVGIGDPLVLTEADEVISDLREFKIEKYRQPL